MGATAKYALPYPAGSGAANGPDALEALANQAELMMGPGLLSSWSPLLYAGDGETAFALGNGRAEGWYVVRRGWCLVFGAIYFGSTTNGGTGQLVINLPRIPTSSNVEGPPGPMGTVELEQEFRSHLYVPSAGYFDGFVYVRPSQLKAFPYFPINTGSTPNVYWPMNSGGSTDPQCPTIGGGEWPIQAGGNLRFSGQFYFAA